MKHMDEAVPPPKKSTHSVFLSVKIFSLFFSFRSYTSHSFFVLLDFLIFSLKKSWPNSLKWLSPHGHFSSAVYAERRDHLAGHQPGLLLVQSQVTH